MPLTIFISFFFCIVPGATYLDSKLSKIGTLLVRGRDFVILSVLFALFQGKILFSF